MPAPRRLMLRNSMGFVEGVEVEPPFDSMSWWWGPWGVPWMLGRVSWERWLVMANCRLQMAPRRPPTDFNQMAWLLWNNWKNICEIKRIKKNYRRAIQAECFLSPWGWHQMSKMKCHVFYQLYVQRRSHVTVTTTFVLRATAVALGSEPCRWSTGQHAVCRSFF